MIEVVSAILVVIFAIVFLVLYSATLVVCAVTAPIWLIPYLVYKRQHKSDTNEDEEND